MRRVAGRTVSELEPAELDRLAAGYGRVVIDVATGDGQAVLRRARRDPEALFIGVDAVAENMREASHRSGRPPHRGGVSNALFVAAAVGELPGPLRGRADEVTVVLPWGSLLRDLLAGDAEVLAALRALLRPGGRLELLISVAPADTVPGSPPLDEPRATDLAQRLASPDLAVASVRPAETDDIERLGSSWARRLGIPRRRQAWLLSFSR